MRLSHLLTRGKVNGKVKLSGTADGMAEITANVVVNELAFGDASGLRAGENIGVEVHANAMQVGGRKDKGWSGEGRRKLAAGRKLLAAALRCRRGLSF